jgi:hypothetical protein
MKRETCFLCKTKNNLIETKLCNNCFSYNFNTEDKKEPKFIIKGIKDLLPILLSITSFVIALTIFLWSLDKLRFYLIWIDFFSNNAIRIPIALIIFSSFFLGLQLGSIKPKIKVIVDKKRKNISDFLE